MSKLLAILLFIVFAIFALVPIGLCVLTKHDDFLEVQKDSENEK